MELLPPLLSERPREHQLVLRFVVPAVFGVIVGIVLGASAPIYWVLQVIAAIGGLLAGLEHREAGEGALRGVVGGLLFGAFILIAHEISGADAEVDLGDAPILLPVVTAIAGAILGALGARVRVSAERRSGTIAS